MINFVILKNLNLKKKKEINDEVIYKFNDTQFKALVYLTYSFRTINLIIGIYSISLATGIYYHRTCSWALSSPSFIIALSSLRVVVPSLLSLKCSQT